MRGDETCGGGLGLEASQPPHVGTEGHQPQVRLVPEQGHRDHLVTIRIRGAHGLVQGIRVEIRGQPTEEVEDSPAGDRGKGHAASVENPVRPTFRSGAPFGLG